MLGCATGEEAYSIAILLAEYLATLDEPPHVQIFATDLDARALGSARAGRYSCAIAEHVTAGTACALVRQARATPIAW